MKIKYNNKSYCISKCAKDTFQTWILEPLLIILVITTIYSLLAVIGFITEGILVSFFKFNAFYHTYDWLMLGLIVVVATAILTMSLQGLYVLLRAILGSIRSIYSTVSAKVNGTYVKHYKKSCHLFEECE